MIPLMIGARDMVFPFVNMLSYWFYLLSVFVFLTRRERRDWYRGLATFMAGMMSYAMTLYFSWQILGHRETGAQLGKVLGARA